LKTYENRAPGEGLCRSHPWSTTATNPSHRYYDFRARPDLIPSVLEDFRPWDAYPAVRSFYDLLAWINGPASPFASNDCAFNGPEVNTERDAVKRLECSGRLGLLFRDLSVNTDELEVTRLIEGLHERLQTLDPGLVWGAVGTTRLTVDFLELPEGAAHGSQVLLSFWAWGDDEPEVFAHLSRVIAALSEALESLGG
jgi:hypothetical protein